MELLIIFGGMVVTMLILITYAIIIGHIEKKAEKREREDITAYRSALLHEIESLPANRIGEVKDFVAWIKHHKPSQISETVSRDWDTQERDKALASL
jgi:hypothetical protein